MFRNMIFVQGKEFPVTTEEEDGRVPEWMAAVKTNMPHPYWELSTGHSVHSMFID
jgi:hypothetical protein